MKYKNILWDWNGTILNDTPVAFEATNILLERYNYPTITKESCCNYPGRSKYQSYTGCNSSLWMKPNEAWLKAFRIDFLFSTV